jgi:sugar-specific transcriptional regulator TrmB
MNSYKLNGIAGHLSRNAIVKKLNIPFTQIYKTIKSISTLGVIETVDGKKYILELKELKE